MLTVVVAVVLFSSRGGEEPLDFTVAMDVDLGLDPTAQLVHSFSTGVWQGEIEGEVLTIREYHLFGDEGGESTTIRLSTDGPVVLLARYSSSELYSGDDALEYRSGTLHLQSFDLDGIVAGILTPDGERPVPFWVDLRPGAVVREPSIDVPFAVPPGGVVTLREQTVVRFDEVVEDSRCPEDATCVWEGAVEVALTIYEDGVPSSVRLRGLSAGDGPVFGDSPTIEVMRGLQVLSLVALDEGGATFVTSVAPEYRE